MHAHVPSDACRLDIVRLVWRCGTLGCLKLGSGEAAYADMDIPETGRRASWAADILSRRGVKIVFNHDGSRSWTLGRYNEVAHLDKPDFSWSSNLNHGAWVAWVRELLTNAHDDCSKPFADDTSVGRDVDRVGNLVVSGVHEGNGSRVGGLLEKGVEGLRVVSLPVARGTMLPC
jgi:hypothetical protein